MDAVQHRGNLGSADAATNRRFSPNIWASCPLAAIREGRIDGIICENDFASFRTSTNVNAAEAYWAEGLKVFGSDGAAIAAADEIGGVCTFSSDGDNEGVSFGTMIYPFQIIRIGKKLWFEMRVKTSTIADTKHGFLLGLIDSSALSATVPIAAAGTLADENFVGFHRLEGDGDYVDTVYKADSVTQVNVKTDAKVLVADEFVKLGMVFDVDDAYLLKFYADNLQLADTKTIPAAAGTDFPNDVRLGVFFALLNATASTPGNTSVDWFRCVQLI